MVDSVQVLETGGTQVTVEVVGGPTITTVEGQTIVIQPEPTQIIQMAGNTNFYVGPTNPGLTEGGMWVQTGLGDSGNDFTIWIEDGK